MITEAGLNDIKSVLPDDLTEPMVNKVLVLVRLGTGVARTGVMTAAELFSSRVLGVAGESKSLSALTPL